MNVPEGRMTPEDNAPIWGMHILYTIVSKNASVFLNFCKIFFKKFSLAHLNIIFGEFQRDK